MFTRAARLPERCSGRKLVLPPISIVVLYIVLGRLNRYFPWDVALADPAVKTLLQDAQVLLREVLELFGSSPEAMSGLRNQARLPS